MKSIYRNEQSQKAVWQLYDRQMDDLKVPYAELFADTIGHPGKSAEVSLSPRNQDYGKWAVDVIKGLGFKEMACFGGSFGAGILVKAMCVAPEVVKRSVLIVPSAIQNAPAYKSISMAFPMLMYWLTHSCFSYGSRERLLISC